MRNCELRPACTCTRGYEVPLAAAAVATNVSSMFSAGAVGRGDVQHLVAARAVDTRQREVRALGRDGRVEHCREFFTRVARVQQRGVRVCARAAERCGGELAVDEHPALVVRAAERAG